MPWEIVQTNADSSVQTGRWLYTKAGNVDRFGSLLSYNPSSMLGVWVVANAAGEYASDLGKTINDIIWGWHT